MLLLLLPLLFGFALSQGSAACGASPPATASNMPPQKVLYFQIDMTSSQDQASNMERGYTILQNLFSTTYAGKGHSVDFIMCTQTSCISGLDLSTYTQIWVNDVSSATDNAATQMAGYQAVANWFTQVANKPHIICDGRFRASLWDGDGTQAAFNGAVPYTTGNRPNAKLIENYFVNLGIRGGGLVLGTDHAPYWTYGINYVNDYIGISEFTGNYFAEPYALEIDSASPVMSYPGIGADFAYQGAYWLWDDSSTAYAPISEQSNGQLLYPIGWHGGVSLNLPGVSTTIRGSVGFLIDILTPSCGELFFYGDLVTFLANQTAGDETVLPQNWVWTSNLDGQIGTGITFNTTKLSPGQHTVTVRAEDTVQHMVAVATVVVYVIYTSGQEECIVFARDNSQVFEYYPILRSVSAVNYFSYGSPIAGQVNTLDHIETRDKLSANFGLYDDGDGLLSLIWVNSANQGPATLDVDVTFTLISGTPLNPTLIFVDSPNDPSVTYDPTTLHLSARWAFQLTTKGFIIGKLPTSFDDRWCVNIAVNTQTIAGLDWVDAYGLPVPPQNASQPIVGFRYGDTLTKNFQFCRTQCNCEATQTYTTMLGQVAPVRVTQGNNGSVNTNYTRGLVCTWVIAPNDISPVLAMVLWWTPPFQINPKDSVSVFEGPSVNGTIVWDRLTGNTPPSTPRLIPSAAATAYFYTNDSVDVPFGWTLNWVVQPNPLKITPNKGVFTEPTIANISGTNFYNNPTFRVQIKINGTVIYTLTPLSITPFWFTISIPPQPVLSDAEVYVANDYTPNVWAGPLAFNWYDGECANITTCAGCVARSDCGWCNNVSRPNASFCMAIQGVLSCPAPNKLDQGCCTMCYPLNGCSGGGKCICNDTCVCDPAHWSANCACLQCPIGPNGQICSGFGTCGCNGTCTCDPQHRGADCSCLKCGGVSGPCENHGVCNCDGNCTCNPGWTNPTPLEPYCACSTVCPNNCSGHGTCKCGVCVCDLRYTALPDCSCKDCDTTYCPQNQQCGCDGQCACAPGYYGPNCNVTSACDAQTCPDCVAITDCGWCDGADVCENIYKPVQCAVNPVTNPRGFQLIEKCPAAVIAQQDPSDDKASVLLGAVVGSLLTAAAGLAVIAYLLKGFTMAPTMAANTFELPTNSGFVQSPIYEGDAIEVSNPIFE